MKIDSKTHITYLIFISIIIITVIISTSFFPYQIDDSYITYQYAKNFILHGDLSFNPGHFWTEGFSSPAWLFLLIIAGQISNIASLPNTSMLVGLACLIFSQIITLKISILFCKHIQWQKYLCLLLPVLFTSIPGITFYASTGLETLLFILFIVLGIAISCNAIKYFWIVPFSILLPWIRPEAPALILIIIALYLFFNKDKNHCLFKKICLAGGLYSLSHISLLLLRWHLFEEFFPNTYFAKTPSPALGFNSLIEFISEPYAIAILILSSIAAFLGEKQTKAFYFCGFFWVVIFVFEGGDWMPLGRLLLPSMIFFITSIAIFTYYIITHTKRFHVGFISIYLSALIIPFGLSTLSLTKWQTITQNSFKTVHYDEMILLNLLSSANIKSIAAVDIGKLAFYSDLEILDIAGLTDQAIAHSPGSLLKKKFDPNYIFLDRKSDAILIRIHHLPKLSSYGDLTSLDSRLSLSEAEKRILIHPDFQKYYTYGFAIFPKYKRNPFYGIVIFIKINKLDNLKVKGLNQIHYSQFIETK